RPCTDYTGRLERILHKPERLSRQDNLPAPEKGALLKSLPESSLGIGSKQKYLDYRLAIRHNRLMADDNRFMSELFRIVNGALRLDIDKVRNYTAFLADKLEKSGDKASALRLRKMLEENDLQLRPAGTTFAKTLPVDSESRFPLVERVNVKAISEPPVLLSQEQWDVLNEFLSVTRSHAQVDAHSAPTSLSLLMYGPPGTGKSRL